MALKVFYSDRYTLPLPETHRFPMTKYSLLKQMLLNEAIVNSDELFETPLASIEDLCLAHDLAYVESMRDGSIDVQAVKRIGFPWSHELYLRSCATVGGAMAAAHAALENGISGNLAGGTHHAHRDFGSGYCVFNDIACASRMLVRQGLAKRIAVIDLDVHQGDGNSSILGDDCNVFILSLHGEKNFPFRKVASTLDVPLKDHANDEEYLEALEQALPEVWAFRPDFIFYQTGVDPLKEDVLGRLDLTHQGLMERDRRVLSSAKSRGIPVSLALGGGYAKPIELSVLAYANTYRVVREIYFG